MNKTQITDVQNLAPDIIPMYRKLWGSLSLEEVQSVYKVDGLDISQIGDVSTVDTA